MDGNQTEMLEKLMHMKKELARKEKKLKKCARAASAKEYVKRRLREQDMLEGKANVRHLTSDLCLPPQVPSDTCQTYKSPDHTDESSHSAIEVGPGSKPVHFDIGPSSKCLSVRSDVTEPAALRQKTSHQDQQSNDSTSPLVSITLSHNRFTKSLDVSSAEPGPVGNMIQPTAVKTPGSTGVLTATTSQYDSSPTTAMESGSKTSPDNSMEKTFQHLVSGDDKDENVVPVHRTTCLEPDEHKSKDNGKHFFHNNKKKDVVCARTCMHGTTYSIAEIPLSESNSDKGLSGNSSGELVNSSAEHQGRRSLSLKRKRNISNSVSPLKDNKCCQQTVNKHIASSSMVDTTTSNTDIPVNLPQHTDNVGRDVQRAQNIGRKSKSTNNSDSSVSNDDEKVPEVAFKQIEPLGKKPPVGRPKKPEPASTERSENSRVKKKCVKRRRRTIGRILDVDLEKDINFSFADSESSQNSEEYETLRLIQQSYRSGVDYSTRHGKTHNLPSMLSSIFQYFIDENRRQKDPTDFSLPEDQFGKLMRKRLKLMTGELSDNTQHSEGTHGMEHHMVEPGLNFIETSQDLFHHPHRRGMKSTDHPTNLKSKDDSIAKEAESCEDLVLSHQHAKAVPSVFHPYSKAGDVTGDGIIPIADSPPRVSVQCPQISTCDHTKQHHSEGDLKTNSHHLCKEELLQTPNISVYNNTDMKLFRNCLESPETPKCETKSCVDNEEYIPTSPALFASTPEGLGAEDSLTFSMGDSGSQDSQFIHTHRSNKGERLKHLGCIKLSEHESLRCVAACCIQIGRRRTDVLLCIGQSTISLWNQTGDTYTCVNTWQLEQDYSSVECFTYPAVFRDKFCYFVVVLRGVGCTVQVVHYNAGTDTPQFVQCLQGNGVTACCLSVVALAVGQTNQDITKVTKYSVDCDGQLMVQQEFDPSPDGFSTPRCLMLVENLQSALALWSSSNTLVLWNADTGTLVWTLDLSLTWPEMSTLVSAQWQQDYLLLSLLNDKKSDDAGVLLVVNPETEISKVLVHYTATSWEGMKCVGQLEDSIAATDHRGQTYVWDPYSGQLSYQCDPSTGVKGLGHYWRKLITMYSHCVHIFR